MRTLLGLSILLAAAPSTRAADVEAGKAKVATVCAACHGTAGVSVSDTIPNLAAQRAAYVEAQLKAFKDGTRKSAIMAPIAAQLATEDVANVAAYFASLPGAAPGTHSDFMPAVAKTRATVPESYKADFTMYATVDAAGTKQVRRYYANATALKAARDGGALPDGSIIVGEQYSAKLGADGKPLTGADGRYVPDKLVGFAVMEREAGWGKDIPEVLRNGDWNYAAFTSEKKLRPGLNQAECLACHKPLDKASHVYTLEQLAGAR